MTNTSWKALTPAQACDWTEFWMNKPWPIDKKQIAKYAEQLGWTAEEEDDDIYLTDAVSGFSIPDVMTTSMPSGEVASIDFYVADVIRDVSDESIDFLSDQYTLIYREAEARWGAGKQSATESHGSSAVWDWEGKGRVTLSKSDRSVSINFDTPQFASVLRDLGE